MRSVVSLRSFNRANAAALLFGVFLVLGSGYAAITDLPQPQAIGLSVSLVWFSFFALIALVWRARQSSSSQEGE